MKLRYILLNAYAAGGTIRTVVNQANAMAARHDVEIVSVYRSRRRPAFDIDPAVRLTTLIDNRRRRRYRPISGPLSGFASRLVPDDEYRHHHMSLAFDVVVASYLATRRGGVTITTRPGLNLLSARFSPAGVVTVGQDHSNLRAYKPKVRAAIERWYHRLDAVTVLTRADEKDYYDLLAGRTRIEHIPNPRSDTAPRRSEPGSKLIVSAGRLTGPKGFRKLIAAFARVAAGHPDWRLHIYGSGPQHARLAADIAATGLGDRVQLRGYTSQLADRLAEADVFALSSKREGAPMVLLEAMGHGLACVAFDCHTGPAELLDGGDHGVLVPPGDVAGLAEAMSALMDDPDRRRELGKRAADAASRYDPEHIMPLWTNLFAELSARGASRRR